MTSYNMNVTASSLVRLQEDQPKAKRHQCADDAGDSIKIVAAARMVEEGRRKKMLVSVFFIFLNSFNIIFTDKCYTQFFFLSGHKIYSFLRRIVYVAVLSGNYSKWFLRNHRN